MASKRSATWWRDAAIVGLFSVVLGAVISASVALVVADRTTDASAEQLRDQIAADREQLELSIEADRTRQEAQIVADREDRDRTRLASVYATFTDASNAFAFVALAQQKCIKDNLVYADDPSDDTVYEEDGAWACSGRVHAHESLLPRLR